MAIGYVHNADQEFHINGLQVSGVSSLNASYNIPTESNDYLGYVGPAEFIQMLLVFVRSLLIDL